MKCCDYGNILSFFFQNLFCHICGRSMRNGIMHMQQVKIIIFDHIHHCTGQCGFVRRIIKQRISRHLHFVVKNIGNKSIQPYRLLVSNKMHLVAFLRNAFPNSVANTPLTAKSWITNNSYSHGFSDRHKCPKVIT